MNPLDEINPFGETPPIEVMDRPLWRGTFDFGEHFYCQDGRPVVVSESYTQILRVQAIELARRYYRRASHESR